MMRVLWIAVLVGLGQAQDSHAQETPALKLRSEQTQRVRALARSVQTQATLLQTRLDERQRELTELDDHYELDERRAEEVQAEIVDLQRAMLANHHRMQVDLRAIVDQERFAILRQRLRDDGQKYTDEGETVPFTRRLVRIRVQGDVDVVQEVLPTRHGVVFNSLSQANRPGEAHVLCDPQTLQCGTTVRTMLAWMTASNWTEFCAAMEHYYDPGLHIVYRGPLSSPTLIVDQVDPAWQFVAAIPAADPEQKVAPRPRPADAQKPDDPRLEAAFRVILRPRGTPHEDVDAQLNEVRKYVEGDPQLRKQLRGGAVLGVYLIEESTAGRLKVQYGSPYALARLRELLQELGDGQPPARSAALEHAPASSPPTAGECGLLGHWPQANM